MTELDFELKHDSQEYDSEKGPIIKAAAEEAKQRVCGDKSLERGQGHAVWAEQKRILEGKGIDWKSPKEMNPGIVFD